ncbi:hypothetical protein EUGRSUZ_K02135 [Eucalyptus grandis]|uniref:Uncharacterized protein n=2 Tax=Eucalyptus grandis TaxID=71139 RepID=A0ACC3IVU1_EUCGR|nr:hypothetical protein EUGRSUZ_K02135 [Eucalyptus grandis]
MKHSVARPPLTLKGDATSKILLRHDRFIFIGLGPMLLRPLLFHLPAIRTQDTTWKCEECKATKKLSLANRSYASDCYTTSIARKPCKVRTIINSQMERSQTQLKAPKSKWGSQLPLICQSLNSHHWRP